MNPKRFFTWGTALSLAGVAVLVSLGMVAAQTGPAPTQADTFLQMLSMNSASYSLNWDVMANGGGEMTSASYRLRSTVGQNAIGPSSSASYSLHAGFWQWFTQYIYLPSILR